MKVQRGPNELSRAPEGQSGLVVDEREDQLAGEVAPEE